MTVDARLPDERKRNVRFKKKKCTFLAKTFLLFTYRIQMCHSLLKTLTGVRCSVTQHTHIGPIQRVVTFFYT